ncbi:hypothetical protein [Planktothricoides raciborskii]|uniref:Peptidase M48 domain-containing protein n=1 Tax=Planktothricoides raciborskii GIHE-MW2 TaxID=2792601 RepID=A0AAU8JHM0_9CYAN
MNAPHWESNPERNPVSWRNRVSEVASCQITSSNTNSDSFQRGWQYLDRVRQLTPEPGIISLNPETGFLEETRFLHTRICTWIGDHIDAINLELTDYLEACHQCFPVAHRQNIQIFAAPLASRFGIDGLCNILLDPIAILIDVGRVNPEDWLGLVVHEYAHAHLKSPGHDRRFLEVLTHLCLGLGLVPPVCSFDSDRSVNSAHLRNWPHCSSTANPLAFWLGLTVEPPNS